MEIIPVLDVMGGKAVAGKSGRRWEYKALKTVYSNSQDPLEIGKALPYKRLYVADLDGIMKGRPDYALLTKLSGIKRLMVDVGTRDYEDFKKDKELGVDVIIATETLRDEKMLSKMAEEGIISIDMKDGAVLSQTKKFTSPKSAFEYFRERGARSFIFLDISAVGTLAGNRFDFLSVIDFEDAEVIVGGGIVADDLPVLERLGVDAVLVGTALHMGLI